MADLLNEDADSRSHLAALGPAALAKLRRILEAHSADRTEILRALTPRPAAAELATLIAMADTDEVVRVPAAPSDPRPRRGVNAAQRQIPSGDERSTTSCSLGLGG